MVRFVAGTAVILYFWSLAEFYHHILINSRNHCDPNTKDAETSGPIAVLFYFVKWFILSYKLCVVSVC